MKHDLPPTIRLRRSLQPYPPQLIAAKSGLPLPVVHDFMASDSANCPFAHFTRLWKALKTFEYGAYCAEFNDTDVDEPEEPKKSGGWFDQAVEVYEKEKDAQWAADIAQPGTKSLDVIVMTESKREEEPKLFHPGEVVMAWAMRKPEQPPRWPKAVRTISTYGIIACLPTMGYALGVSSPALIIFCCSAFVGFCYMDEIASRHLP